MRLWTIHPQYLDGKGLGALWREGLGALRELCCQPEQRSTYYKHPQLTPFKLCPSPIETLISYLREVHREAALRGYNYQPDRIFMIMYKFKVTNGLHQCYPVFVSRESLRQEVETLRGKLALRKPGRLSLPYTEILLNPVFRLEGG